MVAARTTTVAMQVPESSLEELRERGFTVVEGFLDPDELATRFLGSPDLRLYKTELWAKYGGAIDYDQPHHRDFGNHSLVVPDRSRPATQMTSFILLSDVGEDDGPTMVVPYEHGAAISYWPPKQAMGALADVEVAVTGAAGALFVYRTDIFHRGSQIRGAAAARFVLLADY